MPTGNTQQQINYGATANDGQGDPLRTAFIKTDDNFDNVWLAGPAGSNVRITNNTIGVIDTNGNLILSPNGVGVIQTNNHVVPRANRTYDLGSANLQYRTVYANSATLQTLSVSGNLTVSGNIINTGNIVTDTLTIQLANTTTTANAANGAGITVGASDNIATILYNSASNVWTTNIGLSATGNITAPYFIGNGSQLTGITSSYGNSNVTTLLGNLGSNVISGTGNITTTANISGGNILGNGRQLTGIVSSYGNANVVTLLSGFGSNTIATTGNVSAGNVLTSAEVIASGVIQSGTGLSTGGYLSVNGTTDLHDTNVIGTLSVNVIKSDDSTVVKIEDGVEIDGDTLVNGNVTADYFVGNGSQLTGISAGANTGNVTFNDVNIIGTGNLNLQPSAGSSEYLNIYLTGAADIHVAYGGGSGNVILGTDEEANVAVLQGGNVAIQAGNVAGTKTWTFDTSGNLTLPLGGVVYETNIPDGALSGSAIALTPPGGTNADQQLLIYPTTTDANHLHLTSGNLYNTELFLGSDDLYVKLANTGAVVINSNDGVGNTAQWTFDNFGTMTLPGNMIISGNTSVFGANRALIQPADDLPLIVLSSGANGAVSSIWVEDIANVGTSNIAAVYANPVPGSGNVRIVVGQNGVGSGPNLWDFDTTGNLTVPGNIIVATGIVGSGASPAPYLSGFSSVSAITISATGNITATGNVTGGNVLTTGIVSATGNVSGNYFIGNGSQLTGIAASYGNANVAANLAAFGSNPISTTGNITASNFVGNISITGNVVGTQPNVTLVAGSYSTVFDNTGNLTLPGNTFSVNYANNTPVNAVTRVGSSWTVPVGNNTQSFTVPINNMYQLWVLGNIPNGIIVYNATVSVSNTNVPVIGQQFAWNYEGGGNILMFTSIPAQIIGTAGAISNAQPAVANTNVFTFGINNTSGNTVTVNYGWIAIS